MNRSWKIFGAVAGLIGCAACGAYAQTAASTTQTTTTSVTTGDSPMMQDSTYSGPRMSTGAFANGTPDYRLLNNHSFDYTDLSSARARGLSDDDIAITAKIAEETGEPFNEILDYVLDGETFSTICSQFGLNMNDVYNTQDEKTKIANYVAAYETTGRFARSGSIGMMMSPSAISTTTAMTMAPASQDLVGVISSNRRLRTLSRLLAQTGLVQALQGPGPFTIFAPSDEAFRNLPHGELRELAASGQLAQVLKYHVIPAQIDAAAAMSMTTPTSPPTLEGSTIQVTTSDGHVMLNSNATVVRADIQATNGIVHVIDSVLLPPDITLTPMATK